MIDYNDIRQSIATNLPDNNNREITAAKLRSTLNEFVDKVEVTETGMETEINAKIARLENAGYQFAGVATKDTNPNTPEAKVFYIADGKGVYTNFGGINVTEDEVVILYYDTVWHKEMTGIASNQKLSELGEKVDALALGEFYGYYPSSSSLPTDATTRGYAYVGLDNPYKIWNFNGVSWSDSGTSIDMNDADEEDITRNTDGKLQFKDRAYGDGMGYVILRKDKTFAEQVTKANTIYEIRYDFDLGGASVTIPAGCVLKFEGGKLSNGTITGNGAKINSPAVPIFLNCGISEFDCEAMPEWFGAKADGVTDDTDAINLTFSAFKQIMLVTGRKYLVNGTINMPYNGVIAGGYSTIILSTSSNTYPIFNLGYGCQVHNIKVELESPRPVFHIDTRYVQQTYMAYDSSGDAYKYVSSAKIRVRDIDIICKADSSEQVNCIESFANGFGTGYWQIAFEAMTIHGDYEYAIYLDSGNADGSSKSTWQSDLVFRDIKIGYSRNGIFVGKRDVVNVGVGAPPEKVTFDSVSMQYMAGKTNNFALIDAGHIITFLNCQPWDWEGHPFSVNQAKTNGITINNISAFIGRKNVSVFGDIASGGVPAEFAAGNNTGVYIIEAFFSDDRLSEGIIHYNELTSLPIGCYWIPADSRWGAFLGAEVTNKIVIGQYPSILRISRLAHNTTFAELFTFPNLDSPSSFSDQKRKSDASYAYIFVATDKIASNEPIPGWISMQPELTTFDTIEKFLDTPFYKFLREGFIGSLYGTGNNSPRLALKVSDSLAVDALGYSFTDKMGETLPTVNPGYDTGKRFYLTDKQKPIYYSGSVWNDALGNPYNALTKGPTASRPTNVVDGFFYFDTDLNKPIWYTGNGWIDATGADV